MMLHCPNLNNGGDDEPRGKLSAVEIDYAAKRCMSLHRVVPLREALAQRDVEDRADVKRRLVSFAACQSGPCDQGRKLCPSPEACQAPDTEAWAARPFSAAALVLAAVLVSYALSALAPWIVLWWQA